MNCPICHRPLLCEVEIIATRQAVPDSLGHLTLPPIQLLPGGSQTINITCECLGCGRFYDGLWSYGEDRTLLLRGLVEIK